MSEENILNFGIDNISDKEIAIEMKEEIQENIQENVLSRQNAQKNIEFKKVNDELEKTKTLGDIYHIAEFMNLLELLVKADKIKTEISITLDDKTRECFLHIIKNNPEYFSDFEKIFMLILEDNKIDIDDIPHITKLITKIYIIVNNLKKLKLKDNEKLSISSIILKFIIEVLVREKKINIGSFDSEQFLSTIHDLIDSCVSLIELNGTLGEKSCGCLTIFNKK
jgi:hypothetical protein